MRNFGGRNSGENSSSLQPVADNGLRSIAAPCLVAALRLLVR